MTHNENVRIEIVQTDCVVLPSYREGTPRSLLEAAAMGRPIFTTNTPGCRDVVDDGLNGYLCDLPPTENTSLICTQENILNIFNFS